MAATIAHLISPQSPASGTLSADGKLYKDYMKEKFENETKELFEIEMKDSGFDQGKFVINYTESGGSSSSGYVMKEGEEINESLPKEIRKLIKNHFDVTKEDASDRFNRAELEILPEGIFLVRYSWEDEQARKDQLASAKVFPQWINDRMISLIFTLEFPSGPTDLDDDGDPVYVSTWDKGIFTFIIKNRILDWEIELFKDETSRKLKFEIPDYITNALLEHYDITNSGNLKEEWKGWNKLVIVSPHNDLPFNNIDEHVFYSAE